MNKNLIKLASFVFAVTLGCSIASAERKLPMKEVKPAAATVPVITVPADQVKEKIEEKVVTPAVDAKGEVIKTGKETNAPLSDVKNKADILIQQKEDGKVEAQTVVTPEAPVVEKETEVQKQQGTIFDNYAVKENLKINNPSK